MKNKILVEEFKKLNPNSHYLINENSLALDENVDLSAIVLPEGYSFGSSANGKAYIYDENDNAVLNVEFVDLENYLNTVDNKQQLKKYNVTDNGEESVVVNSNGTSSSNTASEDENEADLRDVTIEEVTERSTRKKGIKHILAVPFIAIANAVKKLVKKLKKEEYDLEDKTIEQVNKRDKKGFRKLFGKESNEIILDNNNNGNNKGQNFEDFDINEKISEFLRGTNISDEKLLDLYRNMEFISINDKDGSEIADIHRYLNENKDMDLSSRPVEFEKFINEKCSIIAKPLITKMKDLLDVKKIDDDSETMTMFNQIISSNNFLAINTLYNSMIDIVNNDTDNFIDRVNSVMHSLVGTLPKNNINKNDVNNKKTMDYKDKIAEMNEKLDLLKEKIEFKKQKLADYYEEHIKDNKKVSKKEYEKYGQKLAKIKELENKFAVLNTKLNALKKFEAKKIDEAMNKKYEKRSERAEELNEKIAILENEVKFKKQKLADYYEEHIKDNKKASMKEYEKYNKKLSKVKELETELSILKNRKKANYKLMQSEYENMDFDGEVVKRASL